MSFIDGFGPLAPVPPVAVAKRVAGVSTGFLLRVRREHVARYASSTVIFFCWGPDDDWLVSFRCIASRDEMV